MTNDTKTETTMDGKHICQACNKGTMEVVDIQIRNNDEDRVIIGCDECRNIEYLSREEAKEEGFLL